MNLEMVVLRTIHIWAGVFWAGSAVFLVVILEPKLRALGPEIQGKVMGAIAPLMSVALTIAGATTIVAGIALAFRVRDVDKWFNSGWGWAILLGFIVSIAAMGAGAATGTTARKITAKGQEMAGRPPTPEEGAEMKAMSDRIRMLGRATAILVIIGVAAMASARFV